MKTTLTAPRLTEQWAALTRWLDLLPSPLLLFGGRGKRRHANPALEGILRGEPEGRLLVTAAHAVAIALDKHRDHASVPGAHRELRTRRGGYRIEGTCLGRDVQAPGLVIAILVERIPPQPLTDAELAARFHLTRREIEVARRLVAGKQAGEIAGELRVSQRTVEHHTEHIFRKVGARSRLEAGHILRG